MKFEVTQRIAGTPEEVEQAMLHPAYPEFLLRHHGVLLEVQPLELEEAGGKVKRRVRYRPKPVIEKVGPRPIPPEWFAFVETSTWDRATRELRFTNVPTSQAIGNMLVNTGRLRLSPAGPGQTERTMDGEIVLKVPFFLKPLAAIAERIIKAEGLKILDGEVPVLERFIAEVIRPGSQATV
jgi:hypothetical protein